MLRQLPVRPAVLAAASVLVAACVAGTFGAAVVSANAATKNDAGSSTASAQQRALALYNRCEPLKVFHPGPNFNPLKASSLQLREDGFPPRPPKSDAKALSGWIHAMSRALHPVAPHPVCSSDKHSVITNSIWAGHEVPESLFGTPITFTESSWAQPSVPANSNYGGFKDAPTASFWTGTGIDDIIQVGCDSISLGTPYYECWTEDFPGGTVWQETPAITAGDQIFVSDIYDGDNEATYFIENETTGDYLSPVTYAAPYVGLGSADYILERGDGLYLPEFSQVYVTDNVFGLSNGDTYDLGAKGNNEYEITSNCLSSGVVLALPTYLQDSAGDFWQEWLASSPYNNSCGPS